tara:strand:+ start:184 stop:438 length:255 start_codon:yes stop_codon:yes gene_type:complete
MSALKEIISNLELLGYDLKESMSLRVQEAIEILNEQISKEHKDIDDSVEAHIEWLGDISRETQIFVDATENQFTEVVDLDGSGD